MIIARHVLIHGRVQGVGYRYSLENMASTMRIAGWVRNRHDGTVEAHLEGQAESVEALLAWCRHGPAGAQVSHLYVQDTPLGGHDEFVRRPTA